MEMIFNKRLAELSFVTNTSIISSHDWWIYMVAAGLGKIIYDDSVFINYRRIGNNASFNGTSGLKLFVLKIRKFVFGGHFKIVKEQILYFKKHYSKMLSESDRKFIELFSQKYNLITAFKKTFYPKRLRQRFIDEIIVRILFLFGIL